jgi:inner membrane protein
VSSIVGHALGGVVAAKAAAGHILPEQRRKFYILMAVTAVLPDLDVIVFILFRPLNMTPHRGASHSLLFAAISALLLTFLCTRFFSLGRLRVFACLFAAYSSHLILDYLMGRGRGIQFFWPFGGEYLSPVQLVPTAFYGVSASGLLNLLLRPATYIGIALEVMIFVPLLYLPAANTWRQRAKLLVVTVVGIVATVALYPRVHGMTFPRF